MRKKQIAIIGSGPAGLFCADRLADHAYVTVFEAGKAIEDRRCRDTECRCDICDVLEGEGGAGGLSDGKNTYSLTRGTQTDPLFEKKQEGLLLHIDSLMVRFGGKGVWFDPVDKVPNVFVGSPLVFESYPLRHIGSDGIRRFIRGFIDDLKVRGVSFYLGKTAYPFIFNQKAIGITEELPQVIEDLSVFDEVIVAAGLQGIPWIENMMEQYGSPLSSGPAGFGIRIETDADVLAPLHEVFYDYKITLHHNDVLSVRSFCCNQRGYVIDERHTDLNIVNVNGHSYLDPIMRTNSSNMALITKLSDVAPTPQDFVRSLGRRICEKADGGSAYQPLLEFMSKGIGHDFDSRFMTNHRGTYVDLREEIPSFLLEAFQRFIRELDRIVPLISPKAIIYAPEIKYYGRRTNIDAGWKVKDIGNLHIIGSGSGYLDSFVAAALSGIVAAEDITKGA